MRQNLFIYSLGRKAAVAMPSIVRCLKCGATFLEPVGPCARCGGTIEMSIPLTGVEAKGEVGQLGTVADSPISHGGREIRYTAPTGSSSETSLVGNLLTTQVKPPIDVGRRGEPRVFACILAYLAKAGKEAIALPATDERGEDGALQIAGDRVSVQIVTAIPSESFWGNVARGSGEAQAELPEPADWIEAAISKKARLYPLDNRLSMLLAVDVVHMGLLADSAFGKLYERLHGDPAVGLGFGAVWLVGPTENHVLTLGSSRW